MMKLIVPEYIYISGQVNELDIEKTADFFENTDSFERIDMLNWPDLFPYKPDCRFKMAYTLDSLLIHFEVEEKIIKAVYDTDQEPVWQDSCVEFFCQLPGEKNYFNFEFNCIGTCLATNRVSREENVVPLSQDQLNQIKRYASLGNIPFDEKTGYFEWKLTVEIPFKLLGITNNNIPEKIKGNFYKCGDGTSMPHYLSWTSIPTEKPDFHRPEYFGEIILKREN
jgi:hypothetical protein